MEKGTRLILGTMTFGSQADLQVSTELLSLFLESGQTEIDTAHVYNDGKTEEMLGLILPGIKDNPPYVATKAHPRVYGKLDGQAVTAQLNGSLSRMKRDKVDLFYLHAPDTQTPVEEALEACARLHDEGKFEELGLSNFPSWMVMKIWYLCRGNGWPLPTVYQGMYNTLSRKPEGELFPALRDLGIRFYAYNPLAGGLLTGKYTSFDSRPSDGRFAALPYYQDRYWKKSLFKALESLTNQCWEEGISPVSAAFRWLAFHSEIDPSKGDGIILGTTSVDQLEQNLAAFDQGRLPDNITAACDAAWDEARGESPEYYRFYTSK